MITRTDAIVLKSMRYRDSSKIVTFFSRRYGKIKGIAKGARDTKSKFGASLEPTTLASVVLYKKEHRELHLISQCDIVRQFQRIQSDIQHMSVALGILELLDLATHHEEENLPLFALVVQTFELLEQAERNLQNLFLAFEMRLAALLGYAFSFGHCLLCGQGLEFGVVQGAFLFDVSKGGFWCQQCTSVQSRRAQAQHIRVSAGTARMFERLFVSRLEDVLTLEDNHAVGNEMEEALRLYLRYHVEGFKGLKSRDVFLKMNA